MLWLRGLPWPPLPWGAKLRVPGPDRWHEGSVERGGCPKLGKGVERFVVDQPCDLVIVVQQELFQGPEAVGFPVREPLGCLFELVGRHGGNGSVTPEKLLAKHGSITSA
jgi:hypothetical protein